MVRVVVKRKQETTENELAHAKYIKKDKVNGKWRYYYDYNDGDGWSNKAGVSVSKSKEGTNVTLFNTKNTKYWDANQKSSTKSYGPLTINQAEDGISYSITIPKKKKKKLETAVKRSVKKSKKQIKKGKTWLNKLFG